MKKFRVQVFTFSQIFLAGSILILVLISLFTANVAVQRANANLSMQNRFPVVLIDAGHGGEDGGAQSASGILEKDLNLQISEKADEILRLLGFQTIMVRSADELHYDDDCKTMREKKVGDIHYRFSLMEESAPCVFLSIHQNHFTDPKYDGAQVFYSKNDPRSEQLAQLLQDSITAELQQGNTRQIKPSGNEIYLLYHAKQPAVMVECGFLSNEQEAQKLTDTNYQTQLALCIARGMLQYYQNGT